MALRRGTNWHRAAALSAILGLYFQLVLSALAIPAAFAAALPGDLPEGYSTIVICTGDGMKRITLDGNGTPVGETEQNLPVKQCAACHLAGSGVFLSAGEDALESPIQLCIGNLPLNQQLTSSRPAYLIAQTRAPPA